MQALSFDRLMYVFRSLALTAVLMLIGTPAGAQCVAQVLHKPTLDQYREQIATSVNNSTLSNLITGKYPPKTTKNADFTALSNDLHKKLEDKLKSFYETSFEPRDVICIALSAKESDTADAVLTYGGKKLVLLKNKRAEGKPHSDGIYGPNAQILHTIQKAALDSIDNLLKNSFNCSSAGYGGWLFRCRSNRKFITDLQSELKSNQSELADEQQDYSEYSVLSTNGSSGAKSFTEFYDRVAALSYLDAAVGGVRPIIVQSGSQAITIKEATFFDPAHNTLVKTVSFLDVVVERLVGALGQYYIQLFTDLAKDDVWTARALSARSLKPSTSGVTSIGGATADLFCREEEGGKIRYLDLISLQRGIYLQSHLANFCGFKRGKTERVFDATAIVKKQDTFPQVLGVGSVERLDADISTALTRLSQETLDQSALLNDVKKLIGEQSYRANIQRLKAALEDAKQRAQAPGFEKIVGSVINVGASVLGLTNLSSGIDKVAMLFSGMPSDDPVRYISANQSKINEASDEFTKGSAAIGSLVAALSSLQPDKKAAADVATLEKDLAEAQQELAAFQSEIAATASKQKQKHLELLQALIELDQQQRRIVLTIQASLNRAVIRDLIGAKLEHAAREQVQECQVSAIGFTNEPSEMTYASLLNTCSSYSPRVSRMVDCLNGAPSAPGYTLLFGGKIGIAVANDRRTTGCLK